MTSQVDESDLEAMRDAVRSFVARVVAPLAREIDREARFPREAWEQAAEIGLLGVRAPERFGGSGLGLTESCLAAEEIATACMSTSITIFHQSNLVVDRIVDHGTPEQQERYLPALCSGERIGCLAITEPGSGSDAMSMTTRAEKVSDGWLLTGAKTFITNAPVADLALVYAKTGPVSERAISLFAVDTSSEGFTRGRKIDKLGWRGSPTGELAFDRCFVPDDAVIGEVGGGERVLKQGLSAERLIMAAQGVGLAAGALAMAAAYAKTRTQFGRPISDFQLIRSKFADMYTGILLGRALVTQTAARLDADPFAPVGAEAAAAKLHTSELSMRATLDALQIFGGYGYTTDFEIERLLRDAKIMEIGGGTSEIQRLIIGKEALR